MFEDKHMDFLSNVSSHVQHSTDLLDRMVNLAQSDYLPPEYVRRTLAEVASNDSMLHQYTAGFGHPRLVRNIAKLYSLLLGRDMDPSNEILVTSGANEALLFAIKCHVDRGEEVIIIEPFYEAYVPLILSAAGGIPRFVPLTPKSNTNEVKLSSSDWTIDTKKLASLFNSRTKMIILNNPHHPLGKVYSRAELEEIAGLCRKFNVLCLSDEAYEWMVYEAEHVRIATLPGMWERTITVCSAGKTFLAPGWKVGWAYGPPLLIRHMKEAYMNSSYTPIQEAVARLLESETARTNNHWSALPQELHVKSCLLTDILRDNGFSPTVPQAGYYLIAKNRHRHLVKRLGECVVTIPLTWFYSEEHKALAVDFVVMCFLQKKETLTLAAKLLKKNHCEIDIL